MHYLYPANPVTHHVMCCLRQFTKRGEEEKVIHVTSSCHDNNNVDDVDVDNSKLLL